MNPSTKNVDEAFLHAIKLISETSSGNDAQLLDLIRMMTKTVLLLEDRINILENHLQLLTNHIVAIVVADAMEGDDNGPVN